MKKEITVNDKMKLLIDNGFRIYPKFDIQHRFAVVIEDENNLVYENKKTIGEYKHTTKTVNEAVLLALDYVFKKLKAV